MDVEFNLSSLDPSGWKRRAKGWAKDQLKDVNVTVGGLPKVRTPDQVTVAGDGSGSARFGLDGLGTVALVAVGLIALKMFK